MAYSLKTKDENNSKLFNEDEVKRDPDLLFITAQMYFEGQFGFPKCNELAYKFWKEAADEHNHGESINALYKLLITILKRPKEGFEYCLKAAKQCNFYAQMHLAELYAYGHGCDRDENEAIRWFKRAKFNIPYNKDITEWNEDFDYWIINGSEVCEYELENNLKYDGMTLDERKLRPLKSMNNMTLMPDEIVVYMIFQYVFERFMQLTHTAKQNPFPQFYDLNCMAKLKEYAENGSISAKNELNGLNYIFEASECIDNNENEEAMAYLRAAFHLFSCRFIVMGSVDDLIEALNKSDENNEDVMFVRANTFKNDMKGLAKYLKNCVRKYPNTADFHFMLSCVYAFEKKHDYSLSEINRALELEYEPSWLYDKADALRLCSKKKGYPQYVIDAYQEFIDSNPSDHRNIPNAYYCIASMYVVNADVKNMRLNYYKGKCAEDNLLPCFEREDDFPPKQSVEVYLLANSDTNSCGFCGKDRPKYKCECTSQAYCNTSCQKSHWYFHKKNCKIKQKK